MFVTNFYQFPATGSDSPPATSDMVMWYRGDSLTGTPGSGATGWNDKAGSTNFNVSGTAAERPTLISSAINGKAAARFDQSTNAQYFDRSSVPVQAQPLSVVLIAKANTTLGSNIPFAFLNSGAGNGGSDEFQINLTEDPNFYMHIAAGDWHSDPNLTYAANANDNTWHAWQFDFNSTSSAIYLDGSLVASGGSISTKGLEALYTVIGNNSFVADFLGWEGDIAEFIFYNRLLTSGERSELDSYVSSYYGI